MNRLCRAMAAAALALAAGCAKDAASLSPFPCAKDNGCPAGLACLPGAGCVKPAADAICAADGDCTGGAASLSCSVGRCLEACSAGAGCASGRTCTSAAAAGVCVADCSAGQACPVGLTCQDAWGKKSCLPDGAGQGAACSAEGLSCGPKGAAAVCSSGKCEQACANGAGCPATRVCSTTKGAGVCLSDCTAGAACPAGTTCGPLLDVAKKGCLAANVAALDAACPTEGAPCGPLGAGGVCTAGRCEPACKAPADCAVGRFCTAASGDGVCLADCTAGTACPGDLVCNGPWAPSGKKLCVASGAGLGGGSTCFNGAAGAACGPKGLGALCDALICTQPCKDGAGCALGSFCSAAAGDGACLSDCSAGQVCGAPFSCTSLFRTAQRACLPAGQGLGGACAGADGIACGPKGAGGTCQQGRCDLACPGAVACPAGRSCSDMFAGVCLIDCTASACPSDLACSGPYGDGKKYCTPAGGGLGSGCATQAAACGPKGLAASCDVGECVVSCSATKVCPSGSLCSAASGTGSCLVDCTTGQACPSGLSCNALWNGNKGCLPAAVGQDKPCAGEGTSCGPRGSGATCAVGLCEASCGGSGVCSPGRVCTKAASQSGGACVADCTATGTCTDTSLVCEGLWHDGKQGCAAAGHALAACAGVTTAGQCNTTTPVCGSLSYFTVQCSGFTCPANGVCAGTNSCNCAAGFTPMTCAGQVCNGTNCTAPNWWCAPDSAPATCTDAIARVVTTCTCADARQLSLICGVSGSCEYQCSIGCDPVAQSCLGGTDKCSLVTDSDTSPNYPACVRPFNAGVGAEGAACTRAFPDNDFHGFGHDDCAKGFQCSSVGQPAGSKTCQRLCRADNNCTTAATNFCMGRNTRLPPDGTCIHRCSVFESPSTCPGGTTCSSVVTNVSGGYGSGICRPSGPGALGAPCAQDQECLAGHTCARSHASGTATVCLPYCQSTCPPGFTCNAFTPPSSATYCF